jgi:cytochrome c peroxidase
MQWSAAIDQLNKSKLYKSLFMNAFGSRSIDSAHISYALAQFLRTLISYQSKYDRIIGGNGHFTKEEFEGFDLMNDQTKGDCLHCHNTDADVLSTTMKFSDNGLDSIANTADYLDKGRGGITGHASENGKFRIPTLRNIAATAPYMHDGRFKTLEEVIDFYSEGVKASANIDSKMEFAHQGGAHLTTKEKQSIVAFLKTMTDSSFISNPEFGNPFKN